MLAECAIIANRISMSKDITKITTFSKDPTALILSGVNIFGALIAIVLVLVRLRSHDFKVPVQYIVNDGGEVSLASWYSLYSLAIFVVFGVVVAVWVAKRLHAHNPVFAHGVLVSQAIVVIISILTINALLGLVSQL